MVMSNSTRPRTRTPSAGTTPAAHEAAACYDALDLDAFVDFDQLSAHSPSLSPLTSRVQTASALATTSNTLLPPAVAVTTPSSPHQQQQQQQLSFAAPSHQYDGHQQLTGLPPGAVESTLAFNDGLGLDPLRLHAGFAMSVDDAFFVAERPDDLVGHHPSISSASDFDMDFDPTNPDALTPLFYPEPSPSAAAADEFVDPLALGPQDDGLPPVSSGAAVGRLWPGMHQQQAAMAKAQQQKRQASAARPAARRADKVTDPIVEEKIAKLLGSMRQTSVASSSDGARSPLPEHANHHVGRSRKDEDEMDEDERLLASEEGKKLSSKERRQLRNKVSARAFRSRRKGKPRPHVTLPGWFDPRVPNFVRSEYIGQLEAELTVKTNEANDLKRENRALMEENTRLSDLTRMLLSSSAFSTFLDTLGASELPSAPAVEAEARPALSAAAATSSNRPAPTRKDPNPHVAERQLQTVQADGAAAGATLDPTMDLSALDSTSNGTWGLGNLPAGLWGHNQPQVFTVMEVPDGPAVDSIDFSALSGKSSSSSLLPACLSTLPDGKVEIPEIESSPLVGEPAEPTSDPVLAELEDLDESDPSFALFVDPPQASRPVAATPSGPEEHPYHYKSFEGLASAKTSSVVGLVMPSDHHGHQEGSSEARVEQFQRLCRSVEAAWDRISRMTSHL